MAAQFMANGGEDDDNEANIDDDDDDDSGRSSNINYYGYFAKKNFNKFETNSIMQF